MTIIQKQFSDEELIARVWDQEEIRNLISRFTYYEAGNRRAEALDAFWVQQPKHQATASYGRNWGFIRGMDEIRAYYVDRCRFGADGTGMMHPFSTKLVCEADDGMTAQGIWMGIAYEMAPDGNGTLDVKWINERMAVDFIKEDGVWKIWHVFIGTNYVVSAGDNYPEQPIATRTVKREEGGPHWYVLGMGREVMQGEIALFDHIPDYPEREAFLNGKDPKEIYSAIYNDQISFPPLPEPYVTFADTTSYDQAGYNSLGSSMEGKV